MTRKYCKDVPALVTEAMTDINVDFDSTTETGMEIIGIVRAVAFTDAERTRMNDQMASRGYRFDSEDA